MSVSKPSEDWVVRLVKAERPRRSVAATKAKTKRLKKQRIEMMRKAEAVNTQLAEAKAALSESP